MFHHRKSLPLNPPDGLNARMFVSWINHTIRIAPCKMFFDRKLAGFSCEPGFDFIDHNRPGGSSFIGDHLPKSVSVFVRDLFRRGRHQLFIPQPGANTGRRKRVFGEFHNASNDVLQEDVSSGNLGMAKGAKTLHLLRQGRERSRQRSSNCVVASVFSPCRSSYSQVAMRNACSEWKPRPLTAMRTFSRSLAEGC